jgi:hypothetical protein
MDDRGMALGPRDRLGDCFRVSRRVHFNRQRQGDPGEPETRRRIIKVRLGVAGVASQPDLPLIDRTAERSSAHRLRPLRSATPPVTNDSGHRRRGAVERATHRGIRARAAKRDRRSPISRWSARRQRSFQFLPKMGMVPLLHSQCQRCRRRAALSVLAFRSASSLLPLIWRSRPSVAEESVATLPQRCSGRSRIRLEAKCCTSQPCRCGQNRE